MRLGKYIHVNTLLKNSTDWPSQLGRKVGMLGKGTIMTQKYAKLAPVTQLSGHPVKFPSLKIK